MKVTTFISLLAALAAAAPVEIEKRQDLSALLGGLDLSSIGPLLQNIDLSSIAPLLQNLDLSSLGPALGGIDLSKLDLGSILGSLGGAAPASNSTAAPAMAGMAGMGGQDLSKIGLSPALMMTYAKMFTGGLEKQSAYKIETMTPLLRPNAKKVKLIHGPYVLRGTANKAKVGNGMSMDPSGTGYMYEMASDFPRDITLISVSSGIVDENMVPIDIGKGLYNHHNVYFDMAGKTPSIASCANGRTAAGIGGLQMPMAIFMGGATESTGLPYTSMDGKFNSGYYLSANARINNMLDVVNYNKEDVKVYTVSEMEYVPGKIADALPASSQVLDISMCDGTSALSVHQPEGVKQWNISGSDIKMTKKGYFLNLKSHMHDGGVSVVAYLNGKQVCNSKGVYGGPGREGKMPDGTTWTGLASTTICDDIVPIEVGDVMRFDAFFDTALHPEREQEDAHSEKEGGGEMMAEGMALFTGSFALAPGQSA